MLSDASPAAPEEFIPLSVPQLQGNEWKYLKECLDTNWVSSAGSFVDRLEKDLAAYLGCEYGVATTSGTAALHIALLVAGVEPGDEVLVSSLTFIAPANAIRYVGAWPVFIDSEPEHWQMDPEQVRRFIEDKCHPVDGYLVNKSNGRRVKAILPVHILGHPCDMDAINHVAREHGLTVIEDATESLGALYRGCKAGNLGHISCFSFNGNKLITTGGGGMVVTNNGEWAQRAKYLTTQAKDDPVEYIHSEIGYNYRLTNIQAALGCAQFEQLDRYVEIKQGIAKTYDGALGEIPGITPMTEAPWASSAFWLYTVLVDEKSFGTDNRGLMQHLESSNIQSRLLWQPLHLSPAHAAADTQQCPQAELIYQKALSLPCSVGLQADDQARVIQAVAGACQSA